MVKHVCSRKFVGDTPKDAYLKAVRWYAETILNDDALNDGLIHTITRDRKKNFPTYVLDVFLLWDIHSEKESYCARCQELASSFLGDGPVDCAGCKLSGFFKTIEAKMLLADKVKRSGVKANEEKNKKKDRED